MAWTMFEYARVTRNFAGIKESSFQTWVVTLAREHGWRVFFTPDSRRVEESGWPDLALLKDRFVLAELKGSDGRLRADQKDVIAQLRACGVDVRVWRPGQWEEIVELLTGGEEGSRG